MTPWQSESCVESVFAMQLRINSGRRADRAKQASKQASERPLRDPKTHARMPATRAAVARTRECQPCSHYSLCCFPLPRLPLPLPLLLLLSSKSIILSATNAALFLPSAYCCRARLAQICTPKTPETTSSLATLLHSPPLLPTLPPHLPHSEYSALSFATAFCLLFAARPLRTLKCIFYGNFKCSFSPFPV